MLSYTLHKPGVVYHDADETDRVVEVGKWIGF